MRIVSQLDADGFFVGTTIAYESPLEPGVFLMPGGSVDADAPVVPSGKRAKWEGSWAFEDMPQPDPTPEPSELTYAEKRLMEYPPMADYLDGVVKGDQAQINKYITDCLAVKAKYPKPQ